MTRFLGPPSTATVSLPTFSDTVDQAWFIEPLRGSTHPVNYLDRFPEEVYSKSLDSHLVRFMYTLLGPAGIGWLKKNLLDARLEFEDYGVDLFNMEKFYSDPFRFGRILEELYEDDPTGLLDRADWDRIKARDEQYRVRATRFVQGARLGNSPQGMALVAESGIGYPVDVVENYKYLFDAHSDSPLRLRYYGKTTSTQEFVVRPKPVVSRSEVQSITVGGNPTGGNFILSFNGQLTTNYTYQPVTSTTAAVTLPVATIPVTNTGGIPTSGTVTVGTQSVAYTGLTTNSLTGCSGGSGAQPIGTLVSAPSATYSSVPYNATHQQVQAALTSLRSIGPTGCAVRGGPLPNPYTVFFGGPLSNQDVPTIGAISALTGGTSPTVTIDEIDGGIDASTESVVIPPEHQHNAQAALDFIRSVVTIPSFNYGSGQFSRVDWNTASSSSEYSEVLRFVTGSTGVNWPTVDDVYWIEKGIEKQAPRVKDDHQQHYLGFHNVVNVAAYTDAALLDGSYSANSAVLAQYNSVHVGPFTPQIGRTIPFFLSQTNPLLVYSADRITADYAEPLTVTTQADGIALVNGIYPTGYSTLPGTQQIKYKDDQFWASQERTSGSEYVEVDLGSVQAVNFITIEMVGKPFDLEIGYDILDQSPRRQFVTVTPEPGFPWESSLFFDPLEVNPWHSFTFNFTDALGEMIFTRFIRFKLTRRNDNSFLYDTISQTQTPWSFEARNLRIGRNLADA